MFALPRVSCAGLEVTAGPGRRAYQLAARPRVFECADCGRQHSVTAGTVFHRTRTPAAQMVRCGMADRARQARRLGAVSRARTGAALRHSLADAHKLRHGLSERPEYLLDGLIDLTDFLLRRAATRPTITYRQLADGAQINGALPALTG
jgi:hypothetical protein